MSGGDLTHCIHRAHATDKACISERRELEVVEGIHSPRMEALGPLRSALARQHDPIQAEMSLLHFKLVRAEKIGHVGRFSSPRRPDRRLPPARVSGDPPVPPGPPAAGGQFLLQPLRMKTLISEAADMKMKRINEARKKRERRRERRRCRFGEAPMPK